jgi:myosin heavy subunit
MRQQVEEELRNSLVELNDQLVIQEAGIYNYHHPLETAVAYKQELEALQQQIKTLIKNKQAIQARSSFAYENSAAKGGKLIKQLSSLALLAFNQEVENCLRTLKAGALTVALQRVYLSAERIEKFGQMMDLRVNEDFVKLRMKELELTADYLAKKQEERDKARERRAQLKEEAEARRELEEQRERLEKERDHYLNAIAGLHARGAHEEIESLQSKLALIESAIEENDFRASNVRAGYVYIISNEGSFGKGVVKIGMTRRLDPMDRVIELGDASVPFKFSVHAIFFSEDAVALEARLHEAFRHRRLNRVNNRKEFFFVSPSEVREELTKAVGALLEFDEDALSEEFLQSKGAWPNRGL